MNKPKWMTMETFSHFVTTYALNGKIYCNHCQKGEDECVMSCDHIVSRHENGSDEISNLQPLCIQCNSKKNKYPDQYWQKKQYFDSILHEEKLRVSQADFVMGPIKEYSEFFSRPFCNINGKLLTFIQVVGAGKTLGMFSLPFAINEAVLKHAPPGSPRVSKVLIVTKNQSLRDQISKELAEEPTSFGIIQDAPIVEIIKKSDQLFNPINNDHQFAIMCPNMLWAVRDESENGSIESSWEPYIQDVLNRYQLIIFDETHYAYANIKRLLKIARNNLVFGFTASPIDSSGSLLDDMVRVSNYSYDDAIINDGSMKHIAIYDTLPKAGSQEEFLNSIHVINSDNQKYLGSLPKEDSLITPSLRAIQSVADALIMKLHSLDNDQFGKDSIWQEHWERYRNFKNKEIIIGQPYPAHGILVVNKKEEAKDFAEYMNLVFRSDPERFPKKNGWKALAVYGGSQPPFGEEHPFFSYRDSVRKPEKLYGKMTSNCCRIIVVVDMAVEGMNNKFLSVMGIAKNLESEREIVQRDGRCTRVVSYEDAHKIILMPKSHDLIYTITHEEFKWKALPTDFEKSTARTIEQGFDFILNSAHRTSDMLSIAHYIELDDLVYEETEDSLNNALSAWTRWRLASAVGRSVMLGKRPKVASIVKNHLGNVKNITIRKATEFCEGVYDYNDDYISLLADLLVSELPAPYTSLLIDHEDIVREMDNDTAKIWLDKKNLPQLSKLLENQQAPLEEVNLLRKMLEQSFTGKKLQLSSGPDSKIAMITAEISSALELDCKPYIHELILHLFSELGATDITDFEDGGKLHIDAVTHSLRSEEFIRLAEGYCRYKAIIDGHAIDIATVLKIGTNKQQGINKLKQRPRVMKTKTPHDQSPWFE